MQVDTVQQEAGDALLVLLDVADATGTLAEDIAIVAAGTGVHGGDEAEVGGGDVGGADAGDVDAAIFEG
jgi:hypothetical protein